MAKDLKLLEQEIAKEIEKLNIKKAELSLSAFTKQAWHLIEPETKLQWNWHLDTICGYLEHTVDPDDPYFLTRLIINVPPGTLKSILVSVMYPAWLWVKYPAKRVLGISNIQDLAIRDSRKTKIIITSDWFQKRWPLELMSDQSAKTNYENTRGGFRGSLGMKGNITGKRGDVLLIDDPMDAITAQSDLQRQSVLDIYDSKLSSRVNSQDESVIILIMQRLHHKDLTGHLLSKSKTKWIHVVIPMHYDSSFTFNSTNNIGRPDLEDKRRNNELLFPAIFSKDVVEKLEEDLGEYHCTPPYTPITMADMSIKKIEDIKIGDKVLGFKHAHLYFQEPRNNNKLNATKDSVKMNELEEAIKKFDPKVEHTLADIYGKHVLYPVVKEYSKRYIPAHVKVKDIHAFEKYCRDAEGVGSKEKKAQYKKHYDSTIGKKNKFYANRNSYVNIVYHSDFVESLVLDVFCYEGAIYEFTMRSGDKIICTMDHKWFRAGYGSASPYGRRVRGNEEDILPGKQYVKIIQTDKNNNNETIDLLGKRYLDHINFSKVVSYKPLGRSKIYALETSTGSYVAWGYASSNSAGQLEQRPSPKAGGILRQQWFRILDETANLPICDHVFISCDTAYSERDRTTNSYSAFTTWGVFWNKAQQRDCMLLLDVWFDRVDYPELRRKALTLQKDKKPDLFLIEKKASGISLVQDLRTAGIFVRTYTPTTDKVSRAYAIQAMLESGQVWIPDRKWANFFAYQMGTFPTGDPSSNDLADTFTQAALYIRNGFYISHPDDDEDAAIDHTSTVSVYGAHSHLEEIGKKGLDSPDSFID